MDAKLFWRPPRAFAFPVCGGGVQEIPLLFGSTRTRTIRLVFGMTLTGSTAARRTSKKALSMFVCQKSGARKLAAKKRFLRNRGLTKFPRDEQFEKELRAYELKIKNERYRWARVMREVERRNEARLALGSKAKRQVKRARGF